MEYLLAPETPKSDAIANVQIVKRQDTYIETAYIRDDDFRELMHRRKFRWDASEGCWRLKITAMNGPAVDRAADIASSMIAIGIRVRVTDEAVFDKIRTQDYEPECERWVCATSDPEILCVSYPYDKDMTATVRKIGGARWNSDLHAMTVRVSQFREITEFAELFGFRVTPRAQEMMDAYERRLRESLVVKVKPRNEEKLEKDPIKAILDTPDDILPDLLEDA